MSHFGAQSIPIRATFGAGWVAAAVAKNVIASGSNTVAANRLIPLCLQNVSALTCEIGTIAVSDPARSGTDAGGNTDQRAVRVIVTARSMSLFA